MKIFTSSIKSFYFFLKQMPILLREMVFVKTISNINEIPIIINNFNRVTFLKSLIERLEKSGYTNIYIIDNCSTYEPLLEYYESLPYKIYRLKSNEGYRSFWKTGIYKEFKDQYFVYTDSDIVPIAECPNDFLDYFYKLMKKYPRASKVGFGLKIDDLPNCYKNKDDVIEWESRFWENEIDKDIYRAAIDTTFALYRPNVGPQAYAYAFMIRTGGNYQARHLPWYADDENPTEEDLFYSKNAKTSTHWTSFT